MAPWIAICRLVVRRAVLRATRRPGPTWFVLLVVFMIRSVPSLRRCLRPRALRPPPSPESDGDEVKGPDHAARHREPVPASNGRPPNGSIAEKPTSSSTTYRMFGAPSGTVGWVKGPQSGTESLMSMLTVPVNCFGMAALLLVSNAPVVDKEVYHTPTATVTLL